ncbi:LD-carboxypeptidase [Rickettsia bellii]|uniref:LD-carboxypeptidase family protein n=2 Tax=Rickettsia bellii TaxID=33990 RepID=A0A0F3QJC5_RICBE|nr:LD-carboxypeptidase [Rickettsia bellii]ABV79531.1 Microcin C7 resistance protein [Rickettsia bellii OSU 85-389]ARD86325.1 LD-carboxypeptidase [Rickettsia bellii]KJV90109.1 LD-carboxypeptidase family protein [Rickettsia bellii str. RML An4]KJV92251.1 LD-carboxypeptidase family protein [Rickettsia bellii str. RML Mogi]
MKKIIFNKQQDFISIIAPASGCPDAQDRLAKSIEMLNLQGFKTLVDDKILVGDELPFFVAPKAERLRMFKEAMENEQVKIIWAFRGGYGCSEIVEDCFNIQKKGDKILIGYSDITALHLLLNGHYNIPTIHGSVLTSFLHPVNQDINSILNVLKGEDSRIALSPINKINDNPIEGKILGGNLTVFSKLIGTSVNLKTNNILLLEDVNEKGYAIHRNLVQLKNAGIFDGIEAIIFGDFTSGDENIELAIKSFCLNHIPNIKTYRAEGIGHGTVNQPVIMNHEVVISGNYLSFSSPFEMM